MTHLLNGAGHSIGRRYGKGNKRMAGIRKWGGIGKRGEWRGSKENGLVKMGAIGSGKEDGSPKFVVLETPVS